MIEEKDKIEEKRRPSLAVGVYIFNKKGELFLMRAPHWSNKLVIPGGHVDYGEAVADTVIRETKEETGLDIKDLEFLKVEEIVDSKEYKKNKHLVSLAYKATVKSDEQEAVLDGREGVEYLWLKPEEVLDRDDIEFHTKRGVKELFVEKKPKHSFFHHECKSCEKFKAEAEEYKAGWQRAQADYKNLKNEIDKMRSEWVRMSEQQILEEFIPVYDNFKKAFAMEQKENDNWAKGIGYIMQQFGKVLKDHEVEEIKTVGEMFNPELHEAVSEEESDLPEHTIVKEISAGYIMKGKVIQVAKVIVSK